MSDFEAKMAEAVSLTEQLRSALDTLQEDRDDEIRDEEQSAQDDAKEINELRERLSKIIADGVTIKELIYRDGKLDVVLSGALAEAIAISMVELYREKQGTNYVEMHIQDPKAGEMFAVTVQRIQGKTPHQLREESEKKLKRAVEQLVSDGLGFKSLLEFSALVDVPVYEQEARLILRQIEGVLREIGDPS